MPVISTADYEPPVPNVCAGCGGKIADRYYLLAVDRQWHVSCLKCCECKVQLDSELTCFARDGNIYCKEDYYRLFAVKRCARCQRGIFANELVMRARELVYHLHCFTCAWCNASLTQGDYFGLRDNLVYCRTHYELLVFGESFVSPESHSPPPNDSAANNPPPPYPVYPPVGTVRKGRPRKRKNADGSADGIAQQNMVGVPVMDPSGCGVHIPQMDSGSGNSQASLGNSQQQQRTKRMRTSFKHHQLRTMKSYFSINQNPDAKDLKQLAQKTGLSKRVLQVWFQNARAKWRRNNLKQNDTTPPSHALTAASPGGTSSFSEPSPAPPCGVGPDTPNGVPMSGMDYNGNTALVSHHVTDSLASFQELF